MGRISASGERKAADWVKVTDHAAWRPRDSSGEAVHRDRMWFMGGWYNCRLPGYGATNEVWWSTDGIGWQQVRDAGWSPRTGAGAVVFKGRMWILGGTEKYVFAEDETCLRNDIWCSADGEKWDLVTERASWSPRALHQAIVLNDRSWVLGGGRCEPTMEVLNDVWCSEDGANWTQVLAKAPWKPRIWFSAVVYRDRMWVLGGSTSGNELIVDVWYSRDGEKWFELRSDVVWSPRHEQSTFVFKDRIWVAGCHARPLNNEVWSLHIPEEWFEEAG